MKNPLSFGRTAHRALLAALSATLMAACGGGGDDGAHPAAADTQSRSEASIERFDSATASEGQAQEQALAAEKSRDTGRRIPICLFGMQTADASASCGPTVPSTH